MKERGGWRMEEGEDGGGWKRERTEGGEDGGGR